ncbi:IS630 family transposase [Labrys portucalensis]|uniref:IS630 family transposase n=1 Tax=Labrys neptuniae TaxID=376174 RepID=A0ABV6ZSU5_9HYPH
MAVPYSMDLRERVVRAVKEEGFSRNQAALRFGIAVSTAVLWLQRDKARGSVAPGKMGGHKPRAISGGHRDWLVGRCRDGSAFTIAKLIEELAERGVKVDHHTMWNFLHEQKLSFKKTLVASERNRPDVARRRQQWIKYAPLIDPRRLVFIDETWTKTNMASLRGWAERGERLEATVPHGHWKTQTFIAALRYDRVETPWVLDGPINGESFRTYVETQLVANLKPGDIVVMDNLGSHKGKLVRKAIREAGAKLLFLPKYSPDLNPIEQFFAKLKHWLRQAAARSFDQLNHAIKHILERTQPKECSNFFANAGYDRT